MANIPLTDEEIKDQVQYISAKILDGADAIVRLVRKQLELERKVQILENKVEGNAVMTGKF